MPSHQPQRSAAGSSSRHERGDDRRNRDRRDRDHRGSDRVSSSNSSSKRDTRDDRGHRDSRAGRGGDERTTNKTTSSTAATSATAQSKTSRYFDTDEHIRSGRARDDANRERRRGDDEVKVKRDAKDGGNKRAAADVSYHTRVVHVCSEHGYRLTNDCRADGRRQIWRDRNNNNQLRPRTVVVVVDKTKVRPLATDDGYSECYPW